MPCASSSDSRANHSTSPHSQKHLQPPQMAVTTTSWTICRHPRPPAKALHTPTTTQAALTSMTCWCKTSEMEPWDTTNPHTSWAPGGSPTHQEPPSHRYTPASQQRDTTDTSRPTTVDTTSALPPTREHDTHAIQHNSNKTFFRDTTRVIITSSTQTIPIDTRAPTTLTSPAATVTASRSTPHNI